jgi:hypothetical protein
MLGWGRMLLVRRRRRLTTTKPPQCSTVPKWVER